MRSQGPPTNYPSGLQPVASDDFNGNRQVHRRISRTDLDFEQALRAEGTVVLREGVDVNSLGVDGSPANPKGWSSPTANIPVARTISRVALQPSTPIVVPPTPSPVPGPSTRLTTTNTVSSSIGSSSQSSSSHNDLFNEPEDPERQTNRRSMYRSPGTSSSPDLATLLRKAKERGGPVVSGTGHHHKRRESPPPLPDAATQQPGSSNSYLAPTLVTSPSSSKSRSVTGNYSTERAVSSPKPLKENDTIKVSFPHIFAVCVLIVY